MGFMLIPEYTPLHVANTGLTGACIGCGSPRRNKAFRPGGEQIVDLGATVNEVKDLDGNIHGFNAIAVCETCVREITVLIGGTVPEQIERDNIDHWKTRAEAAERQVEVLERTLRRVDRVLS